MSKMLLQVDQVRGFRRLSLGEYDEAFPARSPLIAVLDFLLASLDAWRPSFSVVVAHWGDETSASKWCRIGEFSYRRSPFQSSKIELSTLPDRSAFPGAVESGWRIPRLLVCAVNRSSEAEFAAISQSEWEAIFRDEIPSKLLDLNPLMLVFGFYHQRWISTYLSDMGSAALVQETLSRFESELTQVDDQL
jgi:hypothetical protein